MQSITFEQLSHTSGLSVYGSQDALWPGTRLQTLCQIFPGRFPCNTLRIELECIPGKSFSYSGGGMTVLQLIMETVTGKDFAVLMQNVMLGPLEMTRWSYAHLSSQEKNSQGPL